MKRKIMLAVATVVTISQLAGTAVPVLADEPGEETLIEMTDLLGGDEEIENLTTDEVDSLDGVQEDPAGPIFGSEEPDAVPEAVEDEYDSDTRDGNPDDILSDEMSASPQTDAATTKNVSDYKMFWNNVNTSVVLNGPSKATKFTVKKGKKLKLDAIALYHYNNGDGKTPGTITLKKGNTKIGSWKATGRYYNQWWDVFPNKTLSAGTYTITCSSKGTWSCNSISKKAGFAEVYGTYKGSEKLGKPVISSIKYDKKKNNIVYYKIKWGKVKGATGYEFQNSLQKNFKVCNKTRKTNTYAYNCLKYRSTKDNQIVYVRVRAYKKSGKKYTYGPWSKVKKYVFSYDRK